MDAGDGAPIDWLRFTRDGDLVIVSGNKVRRWDLEGAIPRVVEESDFSHPEPEGELLFKDLTPDGREILLSAGGRLWIQDLETHATRDVIRNGGEGCSASFDSTGERVVSRDVQGVVRVGWARGGEPHPPDGQWIATPFEDGSIRLWPMPDLSKPPLQTLPHGELIAKLKSLTNLRAVRDPEAPTGWTIEVGPFPGWEVVPTW